jgi:hypothetical protein
MGSDMGISILVIGHTENKYKLPNDFKFIQRTSPKNLNVPGPYRFRNSSLVWSEYSAWFENMQFLKGGNITGVCHYRCVLNMSRLNLAFLPFQFRRIVLGKTRSELAKLQNFLIVGKPISTPTGMWQQFYDCHPKSISALEFACDKYDELMGAKLSTTFDRMKNETKFITRNIFITDTTFSIKWSQISLEIAKQLDNNFFEEFDDRWGGFVLERLFSLYVEDFVKENNPNLIFANFLYFLDFSKWITSCIPASFKKLIRTIFTNNNF